MHSLAALCVICAVILALAGARGWGWLLFLAFVLR